MRTWKVIGFAATFGFFTILTQIGGVVLLLAWLATRAIPRVRGIAAVSTVFAAFYALATVVIVPPLAAAAAGRIPLPCHGEGPLVSASVLYCALNRTYVVPEMLEVAEALAIATDDAFPGTRTLTLDASFPFLVGFPMLPHLSHDDGEKLDLALHYDGGGLRSPIGYFAFEEPRTGDPQPCVDPRWPTLRWDLPWLQPLWHKIALAEGRQAFTLRWLANEGRLMGVGKVLVEPHLLERLGVSGETLRFQGCRAARHDDHLHIQL